jgi:hypothetical protein
MLGVMKLRLPIMCIAAGVLALAAFARSPVAASPQPDAEAIFARAKSVWLARSEVPFVTYNLLERYSWRGRPHENWWQCAYRGADRAVAVVRTVAREAEETRLKGAPVKLSLHFRMGSTSADQLDSNPNADAFPILDPLLEPNSSFGLIRREPRPRLGMDTASAAASPSAHAQSTPAATPLPDPRGTPLREITRVEAAAHDYRIALVGTDRLRYGESYHLALTPLHDPGTLRLRDLWIATDTYATLQISVSGLFDGKPYDAARWTVSYVPVDGRFYVQQIKTEDTLRFGLDRYVDGLEFDFVQYGFPETIPDLAFRRFF